MKTSLTTLFILLAATSLNANYSQTANQPEANSYREQQSRPTAMSNDSYTTAEDKRILDKIKDQIKDGWFTKGHENVSATVSNGYVTLTGTVKDSADKEKLEKAVRDIQGVKGLNSQINYLDVKKTEPPRNEFPQDIATTPADRQLNKKIRDEVSLGYFWDSYKTVKLNTNNGTVVLEGTIDSNKDEQSLVDELKKIEGVKNVQSRLTIQKSKW